VPVVIVLKKTFLVFVKMGTHVLLMSAKMADVLSLPPCHLAEAINVMQTLLAQKLQTASTTIASVTDASWRLIAALLPLTHVSELSAMLRLVNVFHVNWKTLAATTTMDVLPMIFVYPLGLVLKKLSAVVLSNLVHLVLAK